MNNTIDVERYDELVAKEERLRLLEAALREMDDYQIVKEVKAMFGIKKETGAV